MIVSVGVKTTDCYSMLYDKSRPVSFDPHSLSFAEGICIHLSQSSSALDLRLLGNLSLQHTPVSQRFPIKPSMHLHLYPFSVKPLKQTVFSPGQEFLLHRFCGAGMHIGYHISVSSKVQFY